MQMIPNASKLGPRKNPRSFEVTHITISRVIHKLNLLLERCTNSIFFENKILVSIEDKTIVRHLRHIF